jgi:tyrosyl-tRNA synthetase
MTADGKKMGKTEKGAVWLDPERTSPYEYYQFWINTDDRDVRRFLALFTFLPMEEVEKYGDLKGAEIRKAKEILAFEATKIVHGEGEAEKARTASRALFISVSDSFISKEGSVTQAVNVEDSIPTTSMDKQEFMEGIPAFKLFETTGLCSSGSEARRLIEQGGGYLDRKKINKFDYLVTSADFGGKKEILIRAGKKKFHRIKIS